MSLTLQIDYPEKLPVLLKKSRKDFEREARMALAVKLFEMKGLSSGMAAKIAGIDRVSFLLKLHEYGAAMINLDEEEINSDIENVGR